LVRGCTEVAQMKRRVKFALQNNATGTLIAL